MKYHSPMKIIFLSLILLAVFLSASMFFTIGLKGPSIAGMVLEELTGRLEGEDPDLTVSFDRLSSDLRGKITLEDVTVTLREEELVSIDSLRINNGFLHIAKNLITKKGSFEIVLSGVDVFISENLMAGQKDSGRTPVPDSIVVNAGKPGAMGDAIAYVPGMAGSLTAGTDPMIVGGADGPTAILIEEEKELPDFDFLLNIEDLRLEIENIITIADTKLSAVYSMESGEYTAEVDVPVVGLDQFGVNVGVTAVKAVVTGDMTGCDFRASSDVMELSAFGYDFTTGDFALNVKVPSFADIDIYALPVGLSMKSLEVEQGDDIYLRAEPLSLMLENGNARLSIKSIIAALGNYAVSTSDVHVGTDLSTFDTELSVLSAVMWQDVLDLISLEGISVKGSPAGNANLFIKKVSVPYLSSITNDFIKDISLDNFRLSAGLRDLRFDLTSDGSVISSEELMDGSTFRISGNADLADGKKDGEFRIGEITIPAVTEPLELSASMKDGRMDAGFSISDRFSLVLGYDGKINADIVADHFSLTVFRPLLEKVMPSLNNYYNEETVLDGRINAELSPALSGLGFEGPVNFMLALNDISFNKLKLSIVTSASALFKDNKLILPDFNISSPYIRTVFSGSIDLTSMIPSGRFSILTTEKGKYIADLYLDDLGEKTLSFDLDLFNSRDLTLGGKFSYQDREHLWSDAVLKVQGGEYAIGFDIDFRQSIVSVVNDRGYFGMKFADGFDAVLSFDEFMFPARKGMEPTTLDGELYFDFDFASQAYGASMEDFRVSNLNFLPGRPDITLSFALDPEAFRMSRVNVVSNEFSPMDGSMEYRFRDRNFAAAIESRDEKVVFSIIDVDKTLSGLLSFENVDSRRFGFDMGRINALLMGRGSSLDDIGFSGDFNIRPVGDPTEGLVGRLSITKDMLRIDDVAYRNGNLELEVPGLIVNSNQGKAELPLRFGYAFDNDDRLYPVNADIRLEVLSEPGINLLEYGKNIAAAGLGGISGRLYVNDISIDGLSTGTRYSTIESRDGHLELEGNFISGTFDPETLYLNFDIDLSPITGLRTEGFVKNGLDLHINIDELNLSTINMTVGSPIYVMTDDSFASGSIYLRGPFSDLRFYGYVWTDKMTADVFWVPNDILTVNNALFILWDNNIKSLMSGVTAVDKTTGERKPAKLQVEVNFNPGLSFDFFRLDAWVEEGNEISLRVPIVSANIDMWSDVSGHFYLLMPAGKTKIGGEIQLSDFTGSFGMQPMPEWWNPSGDTSDMEFDIIFKKNSDIIFPLGPNPILKATLDENQHMGFSIDGDDIKINGKLKLRSGEIFYFQNYFYIRDGEVEFVENDLNAIEPVINLRAQLRDFDENGDKIDIYLTMMDARLDSINPVLSSSPSRDTSEIMNILGQTIVGSEPQGTVGSLVSLVSTGVDVLSRIGVIDTGSDGSLQNSIRTSLNLDAFSLHSNIVENIVFDAISTSDLGAVTPLARYLDGTSLYIGKHVTPEFYMEALAHLVARRSPLGNEISFLSSDLSLDIEISGEWDNPLCSVRIFTQPSYINFQEIFDTLGFTLSKRFVF